LAIGSDQSLARGPAIGTVDRGRTRTIRHAKTVGWKRRLDSGSSSPRCALHPAPDSTKYHQPICICLAGSRPEKRLARNLRTAASKWHQAQERTTVKPWNAAPGSLLAKGIRTRCPHLASQPTINTSGVERRMNRNAYSLDWLKNSYYHNGNELFKKKKKY